MKNHCEVMLPIIELYDDGKINKKSFRAIEKVFSCELCPKQCKEHKQENKYQQWLQTLKVGDKVIVSEFEDNGGKCIYGNSKHIIIKKTRKFIEIDNKERFPINTGKIVSNGGWDYAKLVKKK